MFLLEQSPSHLSSHYGYYEYNQSFPEMMDSPAIPTCQQAAVLDNPGPDAQITIRHDTPVGSPGPQEVLIKLTHTGIWYGSTPHSTNTTPITGQLTPYYSVVRTVAPRFAQSAAGAHTTASSGTKV